MPTYYYQKERTGRSKYGGTYYRFDVWKLTKKGMKKIGDFKINTASYRGDRGELAQFLHKKEGYQLKDGYHLKRKDVKIKSL